VLDVRVFVQDYVQHIHHLRERGKHAAFTPFTTVQRHEEMREELSDLVDTPHFQALVGLYGPNAAYAQLFVDGVQPYAR